MSRTASAKARQKGKSRKGAGTGTGSAGKPGRAAGKPGRAAVKGASGKDAPSARGGLLGRWRARSGLTSPLFEHLKVLFAFLIWMTLVRQQAEVIADWWLYYAQAIVAVGALAFGSVVVVYAFPPRTARWRTLAWTFLASTVGGTLTYAVLGGRAGLLGALICGALVLWARAEENARRAVRRLRERRARRS
ncbi:hypothetical protein OG562_23150 [Streptomyces sp. NBC_01275]|uniref:hypothetical protein n=1 Tax=Streptomyces sp. NBC_01275 TaxID=2903807 RepID=UPI002258E47D|nr:hypothetical protein [Streptomyces sp. NBC_01275]MCX4763811.1 hypothetical protein [Streptomyces sp. NBC_01275]